MKIRDVMSDCVVRIHPEESVAVAARALTNHNIGILPVCGNDGRICGVVTDRDLVTRCVAAGRNPAATPVQDVMSANVVSAVAAMTTEEAARLMGSRQIRRLPVMENGRLCGMVSLGDLARKEQSSAEAVGALTEISSNLSSRG